MSSALCAPPSVPALAARLGLTMLTAATTTTISGAFLCLAAQSHCDPQRAKLSVPSWGALCLYTGLVLPLDGLHLLLYQLQPNLTAPAFPIVTSSLKFLLQTSILFSLLSRHNVQSVWPTDTSSRSLKSQLTCIKAVLFLSVVLPLNACKIYLESDTNAAGLFLFHCVFAAGLALALAILAPWAAVIASRAVAKRRSRVARMRDFVSLLSLSLPRAPVDPPADSGSPTPANNTPDNSALADLHRTNAATSHPAQTQQTVTTHRSIVYVQQREEASPTSSSASGQMKPSKEQYEYMSKWEIDLTALQHSLMFPQRHGGNYPFKKKAAEASSEAALTCPNLQETATTSIRTEHTSEPVCRSTTTTTTSVTETTTTAVGLPAGPDWKLRHFLAYIGPQLIVLLCLLPAAVTTITTMTQTSPTGDEKSHLCAVHEVTVTIADLFPLPLLLFLTAVDKESRGRAWAVFQQRLLCRPRGS